MADYRAIAAALPPQKPEPSRWQNVVDALVPYIQRSYEEFGKGAKALRVATDAVTPGPDFFASMLPGAGLVQGNADFSRGRQAFSEGRYGDAAADYGLGFINAGTDMIPGMAAFPPVRRRVGEVHPDLDLGVDYYRRTRKESPDTGAGYMMFAANPSEIESYGKHLHGHTPTEDVAVYAGSPEFRRAAYRAFRQHGDDLGTAGASSEARALARQYVDGTNPGRIVDSAEVWDDPDTVSFLWNSVLEPRGWHSVVTNDGSIVFDPDLVQSFGKRTGW